MLYFVEHTPVDPVRMTYSNGYQNARTGVGSKVLVFIRPCDPLWVHRGVFHKIACDFYFETEQVCKLMQSLYFDNVILYMCMSYLVSGVNHFVELVLLRKKTNLLTEIRFSAQFSF